MRNERGNALFLTLLTVVFVAVVGVGLLTVTAQSNKTTVKERQDQSLYYIAEAGINQAKSEVMVLLENLIEENIGYMNTLPASQRTTDNFAIEMEKRIKNQFCNPTECNKFAKVYTDFQEQKGNRPIANVTSDLICYVLDNQRYCDIKLKSEGSLIGNALKTRKLEQQLSVNINRVVDSSITHGNGNGNNPQSPNLIDLIRNYASLTTNETTVNGSAYIEGDAGSQKGIEAIHLNQKWNHDKEKTTKVDTSNLNNIDLNVLLPPFPEFPVNPINFTKAQSLNDIGPNHLSCSINNVGNPNTSFEIKSKAGRDKYDLLDLTTSNYHKFLDLTYKDKLDIKIGDGVTYLEVETLSLTDKVTINGSGTLKLLVKNKLNLEDEVNINGAVNHLILCYTGENDLVFNDSSINFGGHIIVKNANVYIKKMKSIKGDFYVDNGMVTIEDSTKFYGNYIQRLGSLTVLAKTEFNNVYFDDVSAVFDNERKPIIHGTFYINNGVIDLQEDIIIYGPYIQLNGEFKLAKRTEFDVNFYLGDVKLSPAANVNFNKDIIIKNANLNLKSITNVYGDIYVLNGDVLGGGFVDLYGNIYYWGTNDITFSKFLDDKKNKLIDAPNAKINVLGSVDIKGIVIANELYLNDNAYIKYGYPENISYLETTPLPSESTIDFTPLNGYLTESPIVER